MGFAMARKALGKKAAGKAGEGKVDNPRKGLSADALFTLARKGSERISDVKEVIPLMPEPIIKQDGETKNDCGYQFEHNFGHGEQNLSAVFAMLMMLAFCIDSS